MSHTDIETVEMEDVEKEERSCDLCKLSYSNDEALQEHNWSLMHHIKIEQKKKGASHNCSLCFAICPNIIEYGKHLNGDKHKRALEESRRQKEGEEEISSGKQALLDKLSDMEKVHFDENNSDDNLDDKHPMEAETNLSDPESNRNRNFPRRRGYTSNSRNFRGHHRSYSQPNSRYSYVKDQSQTKQFPKNTKNSYEYTGWDRKQKNVSWYDDGVNFDNPYWHNTDFQFDNQPWNMQWQYGWNSEDFDWMQYQDYSTVQQPVWGGPAIENFGASYPNFDSGTQSDKTVGSHNNYDRVPVSDNCRDSSRQENRRSRKDYDSYKTDERFSRSSDRVTRKCDNRDKLDSNRGHKSSQSKLDDPGNLKRRRNERERAENKSRRECDSSGEGLTKSSSRDKDMSKRNRHEEVSSSDKLSLPSKRYRQQSVVEKRLDEADSTTDIDGQEKISSRSSGIKSHHSDSSSKKKIKPKKKKIVSKSPSESPKRLSEKKTKDKVTEDESILDRAERLCKDLRDKREKAKIERERKEKQKKIEKTAELNTQIKNLSNINKSYVKGVLNVEEGKLSEDVSLERNMVLSSSSVLNYKDCTNESVSSTKSDEQNFSVDRIRQEIEESVKCSPKRKNKDKNENLNKEDLNFPFLAQEESIDDRNNSSLIISPAKNLNQKSSGDPLPKDSLLKMINSPRSRKERLYIADMLRSYAKSQNKLSLPRFNLQLSGLYDDMEDTAQELHLEELSPDVQLQIAQLIEADIKPDIEELEKALSVSQQRDHIDSYDEIPKTELSSLDPQLLSVSDMHMNLIPESKFISSVQSCAGSSESSKIRSKESDHIRSKESDPEIVSHTGEKKTEVGRKNLNRLSQEKGASKLSTLTEIELVDKGSNLFLQDETVIKQEPTDTGYEHSSSQVNHSDISKVMDKSVEISGITDKDAHFLNLTSIHEAKGDVLDQYPHESTPVSEILSARSDFSAMDVLSGSNSEVDKAGASHLSNVSFTSSMSSLHSENLFETVYDISLKEETLREDISRVDSRIIDLKRVIEEATHHLQKCQEKKQKLMAEEESLRSQRLKILKDAKDIQRSSRNLTNAGSSDNLLNRVYSASTSNLSNNDSTLTNVSSLSSSAIGLVRRVEPERDHHHSHGTDYSLPPPGKLKHRKHRLSESEDGSKETVSTPVRYVSDITSSQSRQNSQIENVYSRIMTEKPERLESVSSSVDLNELGKRNRDGKVIEEATSPVAFKSKNLDRLVHSQLPPPLEPIRVSESHLSQSAASSNRNRKCSSSNDNHQREQSNSSLTTFSPPRNKDQEQVLSASNSGLQEGAEVDRSTELKKAGFVTLNSLLKPTEYDTGGNLTKMLSSEASSLEEFLSGLSDSDSARIEQKPNKGKKVRRSKRLNPEQNTKEKEDENKKFSNVNVKFMGTLPNVIDKDSFLKEIGGGKQPDKLSYMVVDSGQSQDVLQKLQSIIGSGGDVKDGHVESVSSLTTQSSVGDTKLMDLDYKSESSCGKSESLIVHHETDSNYESIASNCSLGEKIKRYCKSNNSHSRKRKEVSIEHSDTDSDLDKTIQDEDVTPVKGMKDCSVTLQKLALSKDCNIPIVGNSPTLDSTVIDEHLSGAVSPSRKRLKTKKERDRKSVRKQKEEYIIDSSSEANSVDEDEDLPKLSDLKQKLKFKMSDSPVKEIIEPLDLGLVETGSEDLVEPEMNKHISPRDSEKRKSLLDEVQLETESEDNRSCVVNEGAGTKERFKLKQDVLVTFREAVKNSIKQGKDLQLKEEAKGIKFDGPESPVSDLQTLDDHLYVCYRCMIIREFHLKTGELLQEYMTKPAIMNCIHVTAVNSAVRLYAGGHSKVVMLFDSKKGNLLNSEQYEESIQCMHGSNGRLYMGTIQGSVIVKHIKTGKIVDTFKCSEKPISCITSATEGTRKVLLIASHDTVIYVCDSSSGLLIRMLEGHNKSPFCVNVDGHTVYSGSVDKTVLEHHLLTGDLIWTYNQPEGIVSSVLTYKELLLCSSYDKFIYCFDKKNRKHVKKLYGAGKGVIHKMVVTPGGQLITGSRDGQVEVIPLLQGEGFCCKWKNCDEVYGLKDHLFHHIQTVHMQQNTRLYRCQWKGCNDWVSTEDNGKEAKDHMTAHIS